MIRQGKPQGGASGLPVPPLMSPLAPAPPPLALARLALSLAAQLVVAVRPALVTALAELLVLGAPRCLPPRLRQQQHQRRRQRQRQQWRQGELQQRRQLRQRQQWQELLHQFGQGRPREARQWRELLRGRLRLRTSPPFDSSTAMSEGAY